MKLLLDQGLPRSAAPLLSQRCIDTIHVGEIGMAAAASVDSLRKIMFWIRQFPVIIEG